MEKRVNVIVRGLVQSVGFRMFVYREASMRGLSGWTRNRPDGSVEIEAQGNSGMVEELLKRAGIGPSRARVKSMSVRETEIEPDEKEFRLLT
ncbi:MAG TPA: acylphosphatase [Chlorobaculum sp.]|jgi:acylphosphatase|nr:acylphosphatase [Chlorobaculum sp.]